MARIRTIKPEFCQSESIGRISREARLLFVNLITIVDDAGRTRAPSRMLASLLYPYDDDVPALIEGWLVELEAEGCIRRYDVEGATYLDLPNWLKHQKIDKPSKSRLPAFEEGSPITRDSSRALATDLVPRTYDQGPSTGTMDRGSGVASQPIAQAELIEPIRQRKKHKTTLPEDWNLSDELWRYGASLGLSGQDIGEEEIKLRLWCKQTAHQCVDRDAFVQLWLRRASKDPRQSHQSRARLPGRAASAIDGIRSRMMPEDFQQ